LRITTSPKEIILRTSYPIYAIIIALALLPSLLFADTRSFVWTYEKQTLEGGSAELEYYLTLASPERAHMKGTTNTEHQIELEVGMNDRFDFGIYQVFTQPPAGTLSYSGFKLRARYRPGELSNYLLPVIYLEYQGKPDFSSHELEFKPIFGTTRGGWHIAVNPELAVERRVGDPETDVELAYAVGIGREINDLFRCGIEASGSEDGNYIGPVISHGTEGLWVTFGSGFAVGTVAAGEPKVKLRLLMGIQVGK